MREYMNLASFKFSQQRFDLTVSFQRGAELSVSFHHQVDNQTVVLTVPDNLPQTTVKACNLLPEHIKQQAFNLTIDPELDITFILENMLLALTDIRLFKTDYKSVKEFNVSTTEQIEGLYSTAQIKANAYNVTRVLNNLPFQFCNSRSLASEIEAIIDNCDVKITKFSKSDIEHLELNGILAVAKGSSNPPLVIKLEYNNSETRPKIGLVGKGVMFDSGGYNLKHGDFSSMKTDMAGCAAVIGTIKCIADLNLETHVVGYLMVTDNLVNEHATVPGDIICYKNGVSVEVINTDAEGRLILADGLIMIDEDNCDTVIDIATLTGNSAAALGKGFAPLYSTERAISNLFEELNYSSTDNIWPMPLPAEYEADIEGDITDIINTSKSKHAGSITAALFLQHFAPANTNWVHIDMGAMSRKIEYGLPVNGYGVRLLSNFINEYSNQK